MDHVAIEAVIDLVNAIIRAEVTHEETDSEMDEAVQKLSDFGIEDLFINRVMDYANTIATGLVIELEEA